MIEFKEVELFEQKIKVVINDKLPPNTFALVGRYDTAIWHNGNITVFDNLSLAVKVNEWLLGE